MTKEFVDGFQLIYPTEKQTLTKIINFLEKGFKWNKKRSLKLYNYLSKQNFRYPVAAIQVKEKNIVCGILLFYQGYNKIERKHIINLSAWYTNKNYRGIETLIFVKSLISSLDKFIITNYTPNKAACNILKSFKFKDMNVRKVSINLGKKYPFFSSTIPFK